MWIERLEFIGFGNLTGQRIEFGKNKLCIVVQPNEYGKSTIAEAIWATLFDYPDWDPSLPGSRPGVERKPMSGAAFKSVLDLLLPDRHMRLIRNFQERNLKVLDLSKDLGKANADITAEFAEAIASDEFGLKLTGLSRNLFQRCCVIGQRQLDHTPFTGDRGLSSLLLNIADSGGTSSNVFEAIAKIEEALAHFPFRGKTYIVTELIDNLENQREQLADTLRRLENDRQSCDRDVERLSEVEDRLQAKVKELSADEYFQLCLEAADIESRLTRAQEKQLRVQDLQNLVRSYARYEFFPIDRQKDIEELWISRQSRLSDLRRLEGEVKDKSVQTQIKDLEYRERTEGLENFSVEDAQVLSSLARTLKEVTADLEELKERRQTELKRVQKLGIDIEQLTDVRHSLLSLEPKDLEEARGYRDMVVSYRERYVEAERNIERARTMVKEIGDQRQQFVRIAERFFWPCLAVAIASLGAFLYFARVQHMATSESPVSMSLLLYVFFCAVAASSFWGGRKIRSNFRINEQQIAQTDEDKQCAVAQEILAKMSTAESRIEELARKAGLDSGDRLIKYMQEYGVFSAQLKELDLVDHMLAAKQMHILKLTQQLGDFFRQASLQVEEITAKEAMKLSESVTRYHDDIRRNDASMGFLDHRLSEIRFLTDEVRHAESLLSDHFHRAGLNFTGVQEGYYQWTEAVLAYRRWETNKLEMQRLEEDTTTELTPSELPRVIERLEAKRNDLWARMRELVETNPDIANMPPPMGDSLISSQGKEMSDLRSAVEELRRERDELTVQLRASMKNYQDNYLKTLEELESIERDLKHVRSQRTSLLLARDTFLRLADENHSIWADKLNDITREMLKHLGTEYESIEFDADLSISVRRKGQREPLNEWHMTGQLSTGTREQLHWLARMAVVRFLSKNKALPIILDEPFSEFDDERFLKIMRFLINNIAQHNQVIIFSCHQQRHEWLMDQLDPRERDSVEMCRLSSLKTDANAPVRR